MLQVTETCGSWSISDLESLQSMSRLTRRGVVDGEIHWCIALSSSGQLQLHIKGEHQSHRGEGQLGASIACQFRIYSWIFRRNIAAPRWQMMWRSHVSGGGGWRCGDLSHGSSSDAHPHEHEKRKHGRKRKDGARPRAARRRLKIQADCQEGAVQTTTKDPRGLLGGAVLARQLVEKDLRREMITSGITGK